MTALHRRLLGGMVLLITAGVSLLAGGIVLGTASAADPKADTKYFAVELAGPEGEGEAIACGFVFHVEEGELVPAGDKDVFTFSAAPTAALKLDPKDLPEGAQVIKGEFVQGVRVPDGELADIFKVLPPGVDPANLPGPNCEPPEGFPPPDQHGGVFYKAIEAAPVKSTR